ncbi:MAG: histidinol-phosphatase [Pseudoflavonifractor sp.]
MKLFYDLHLHSCLSPCGGDDMTPYNLAAMCALAGLQVVALTDHNTIGNCEAFCRAAEGFSLLALPGMELCTAEEVHVICLFPTLAAAAAFSANLDRVTSWGQNDVPIFGRQVLMDWGDGVLGEDPRLLAGASGMGIYDVVPAVTALGGFCYPAHLDRDSFSLLSNLGLWDPEMGFTMAEGSLRCPPDFWQRSDLFGVGHLTGSDAHYLHQIPDAVHQLDVSVKTPEGVLACLKNHSCVSTKNHVE